MKNLLPLTLMLATMLLVGAAAGKFVFNAAQKDSGEELPRPNPLWAFVNACEWLNYNKENLYYWSKESHDS